MRLLKVLCRPGTQGQKIMGMVILDHTKGPVSYLKQGLFEDAQKPVKQIMFHLGNPEVDCITFNSSWDKLLITHT